MHGTALTPHPTRASSEAAFFRLEGALSPRHAWEGALFLAANAQSLRHRALGLAGAALGGLVSRGPLRDPAAGARASWSMLRGFSRDRVEVLGADFAEEHLRPLLRDPALRLVDEARRRAQRVVLISESIDAIARPLGRSIGVDDVLCNVLEVDDDDRATGRLIAPSIGPEIDPRRLRAWANEHGVSLDRSAAYGSARGDQVLLAQVGLPCALAPDRELSRVARELDWPIVEDREGASR